MGLPARLLLLTAICLAPSVAAQLLIARGLLAAAVAVPGSIAAMLLLTSLTGHVLLVRPLRAHLRRFERTLPLRGRHSRVFSEFKALSDCTRAMADEFARRDAQFRQHIERIESLLAERTQALSDSDDRLQMALADYARSNTARELGERQRLAGQLAAGIAHDFNNLLATVLGCLELMERRLQDPERLSPLIMRATDAVERAAKLTSGLAHFARRQPEPRRPTEVNTLVNELSPLIASALGRRVHLLTELAPSLGLAHADPAGLETALLGICLAARAAIPESGRIILITRGEMIPAPGAMPEAGLAPCIKLTVTAESGVVAEPDLAPLRRMAEAAGAVIHVGRNGPSVEFALILPAHCRE